MIGKFKDLRSENVALQIRSAYRRRRVRGRRKTMVFGLLMTALGLGVACALLYYCALFALPVFIGLSVAFWALNAGGGVASALVGLAAGVLVFVVGQFALLRSRSLAVRWMIALLFVLPAAIAGYSLVFQLSEFGIPSLVWRHTVAIIGAVIIGFTAIAQLGRSQKKWRPNEARPWGSERFGQDRPPSISGGCLIARTTDFALRIDPPYR